MLDKIDSLRYVDFKPSVFWCLKEPGYIYYRVEDFGWLAIHDRPEGLEIHFKFEDKPTPRQTIRSKQICQELFDEAARLGYKKVFTFTVTKAYNPMWAKYVEFVGFKEPRTLMVSEKEV